MQVTVEGVIAALALIQPWVMTGWNKFFKRGKIEIYETGVVQFGYSGLGATIGLNGTFRALHADQFVRNVELTVERMKDHSRHSFSWGLFHSHEFTAPAGKEMAVNLPAGFIVTRVQPHQFGIVFLDTTLQDEVGPYVERLRSAWTKAFADAMGPALLALAQALKIGLGTGPVGNTANDVYSDLSKGDIYRDAMTKLERSFYWEPGQYTIEMRVHVVEPDRIFTKKWTVEISQPDSESIRSNCTKILQEVCNQPIGPYSFARAKYSNSLVKP